MSEALQAFYAIAHQVQDLTLVQQLLEWDQEVVMPLKGAAQRAHQLAAVATAIHEKLTDPRYGECIATLESVNDLDETAKSDIREAKRAWSRAMKIPAPLVAARTEACSLAQSVWVQARPRNDFAGFLPHLEQVVRLTREVADAVGTANRYDALLDDYDPGMDEAQLRILFRDLKAQLLPLLDAVKGASRKPDESILSCRVPREAQEAFCRRVIEDMGFDMEAGRLDVSAHPFTNGSMRDVRLTTRYLEDYLPCALFGAIHEAGHGLYEQGLDPDRFRNPAGGFCSMGIHESQSRFWENLIARSRPFWDRYFSVLQRACPGSFDDISVETFFAAVNTVKPSLIRLEADEVTYNLHIMLRFELESDLIAGRIEARHLPGLWNARMKEYLGLEPPEDRVGVMQDIHWAGGLIGYFPSYALGNLYGAQFLERMREDLPDLDDRLSKGDLRCVKAWLNQNIHLRGRRWQAPELCQHVTGKSLSIDPLMRHLRSRCAAVYGI
jgi:carboxypeptidase Taq